MGCKLVTGFIWDCSKQALDWYAIPNQITKSRVGCLEGTSSGNHSRFDILLETKD